MSKTLQFNPYLGRPDTDEYGEGLCTEITAQFIVDMLDAKHACALRMSVGACTSYQMVFINMNIARFFMSIVDVPDDAGNLVTIPVGSNKLSWIGGGSLYVGIERKAGFSFANNTNLHPNYVKEKLFENCDEIAENLAFLISRIFSLSSTKYSKLL